MWAALGVSYWPTIIVWRLNLPTNPPMPTNDCKTTTDLGQALIDGKFDHVGKIKGPILRGLAGRAPYFHNDSERRPTVGGRLCATRFHMPISSKDRNELAVFFVYLSGEYR